jgi:2-polyprenyl-3-methyl-5-hydroxy-6-metoxy-1,4-benzoquinol methylase
MEKFSGTNKPNIDPSLGWENYWNQTSNGSTAVLWECKPEKAAALDLAHFKDLMDLGLPIIDFACGHGTQTRFLADHFPLVIGIDVSKSAIAMAQTQNNASNIEYRVLDGCKTEGAVELHSEIGDANIYMRAGLHHIPSQKRSDFIRSLEILLGEKGILYLIELSSNSDDQLFSLSDTNEVSQVMKHGLRPGSIGLEDIVQLFPNFEVLSSGEQLLRGSVLTSPNGEVRKHELTLTGFYAVIRHK